LSSLSHTHTNTHIDEKSPSSWKGKIASTVRSMSPLRLSMALGMSPRRSSYAASTDNGSPSSSVAGSVYGAPVLKEGYLERETKSGISRQKQWKRKWVYLSHARALFVYV
jgi:hypothetical protein